MEHPVTKCNKIDYLLDGIQNTKSSVGYIQYKYDGCATAIIQRGCKYFAMRTATNLTSCCQQIQADIMEMEANHDNSCTIGATGHSRSGRG